MQVYKVPQILVLENPLVMHSALLFDATTNRTLELPMTIGDSTSEAPCKQRLAFGLKLRVLLLERHDKTWSVGVPNQLKLPCAVPDSQILVPVS